MSPLLETRELGYRYPSGQEALAGVSFAVSAGEHVGLVGPNGAGKSTLLQLLSGVLQADSGALQLGGQVGLVFQQPDDMLFTTRVADDVAFGPRQARLDEALVARRVAESLAAVGAEALADRVPHHLSGGEKRAVAIASVLSMQPALLLLDEPTSGLDPRGRRGLLELLRRLETTQVVASHDLEFVLQLCGRVVVLDGGRIVADGEARAILGDEALMLAHGLERPHSLTPHEHAHEHPHPHDHAHDHGHGHPHTHES